MGHHEKASFSMTLTFIGMDRDTIPHPAKELGPIRASSDSGSKSRDLSGES